MQDKLSKEKDPKAALVVDALNLAFRWKHKGSKRFADEYVNTIKSLAKSYNCGKIIITADWGASTYRKRLLPEYKGNREELRANQTEQEAQDFSDFIEEFEKALGILRAMHPVLKYKGVEADDIAAYIVCNKEKLGIETIWLISSDGDWDLLLEDKVHRFSYTSRKEFTLYNWEEHYKVPFEKYLDYKCIIGDKSDNIPGVHGVGPVKAATLLSKHESVFDLYEALPLPGNAKYINNLNEFGEKLIDNIALMDLRSFHEEAIGQDNIQDIDRRLMDEV